MNYAGVFRAPPDGTVTLLTKEMTGRTASPSRRTRAALCRAVRRGPRRSGGSSTSRRTGTIENSRILFDATALGKTRRDCPTA
jgi:hypothetical protein